jgi:DNA-binding MarR family transcriptional regulator
MSRAGADLAMLLLGGFRTMVDRVQGELAARGYEDVRPVHDVAIRTIAAGADSASELGRRMAVSKQAAAKTIGVLQARGYVVREPDPHDARRKRLRVTQRGFEMLEVAEGIFDDVRRQWAEQIGADRLEDVEQALRVLTAGPVPLDGPAWLATDAPDPE